MDTSTTEVVDEQSKRDTRGRRIMDAQRREELLARYRASGMTQKRFARSEGVNFHTFSAWLAKHRREPGANLQPAPVAQAGAAFVELRACARVPAPGFLEVVLCDGRVARGADAASLDTLARLLEG